MQGNRPPMQKPRRHRPMTSSASASTRERTDHHQRLTPRMFSASASGSSLEPPCGRRPTMWSRPHANSITSAKIPPVQWQWPVNFGLCPEPNSRNLCAKSPAESSVTARKPWSMMCVSHGAGWDCSCPQFGTSLRTAWLRQSLRTKTKAHFLGPFIVSRSDA
jgi:hypothetical protein